MTCRTKRTADDYPEPSQHVNPLKVRYPDALIEQGDALVKSLRAESGGAFKRSLEQEIDRAYTQMAEELSSPLPLNLTPIKRSRWWLAKNRVRGWIIGARERLALWIAPWLRYREDD